MNGLLSIMALMTVTSTASMASCFCPCWGDDEKKSVSSQTVKPNPLGDSGQANNWKKKTVEPDGQGALRTQSLVDPIDTSTDVILHPETEPKNQAQDTNQNTNE